MGLCLNHAWLCLLYLISFYSRASNFAQRVSVLAQAHGKEMLPHELTGRGGTMRYGITAKVLAERKLEY